MKITVTDNYVSCIRKAAKAVKELHTDIDKPTFVFADDKMTLTVENEIAREMGGGFFGVEVLTLSRYISKRRNPDKLLSKESAVMAIRKLLSSGENNFKCFDSKKVGQNLPLALYELISQLKSANVTPVQLKNIVENDDTENKSLKCKLFDIATIFEKYEDYLKENKYVDPCKYTSLMPDLLKNDDRIKGANVIICGFMSLTGQRKEIFKTLKSLAGNFQAFLVGDEKYSNIYTQETVNALKDKNTSVVQENGDLNPTAEILKRYLFSPEIYADKPKDGIKQFEKKHVDNLYLYCSDNPYEEIVRIAEDIKYAVIKGKIRYKDAVIVCGDKISYSRAVDRIFREYEIPYYFDEQKTLDSHPILTGTVALLELIRKGCKREDYLTFLTSVAFFPDTVLSDKFSNYILRYSLSGKALLSQLKNEDENYEQFEVLRSKISACVEKFKGLKKISEYVSALEEIYESFSVKENLEKLSNKLTDKNEGVIADYNGKAYDKMLELLKQTEEILGDEEMALLEFRNLLKSGAAAVILSVIPSYDDAVYVGDFESSKFRSCKYLYAVGMNGDIPQVFSDTAMLTDSDLSKLDEFKIVVDPKIKEVNKREKETVCVALMTFSEKLVISYINIGFNGLSAVKSEIADMVGRIFDVKTTVSESLLLSETDSAIVAARHFLTKQNCVRRLAVLKSKHSEKEYATYYKSVEAAVEKTGESVDEKFSAEVKKREGVKEITDNKSGCFPNDLVSASVLESYYCCPYMNYAKNILKLEERKDGEIKPTDFGTILHSMTEEFVRRIDDIKCISECDAVAEKILDDIISGDQYKFYFATAKYDAYKPLLKREGKRVGRAVYKSIKESSFTPLGSEIDFGYKDSKYKAISVAVGGKNYGIRGKIDRVDVSGDYFRIIDYKTGMIEADDVAFYTGRKLQLYLYMNAIRSEKLKPAGGYYFPVSDTFDKVGDETKYLMTGKTVSDDEAIKRSDVNLKVTGSNIIPIIFDSGKIKNTESVLESDEMVKYMQYSVKLAENAIKEVNEGFIEPTPYEKHCSYCSYSGMCGYFESYENKTRKCGKIKKQVILDALKGDTEE